MEPTIIYEDDALLAVNKPSGLIVYPDGKHAYPALSEWLDKYKKTGAGFKEFYLVHRIDRETSGILLVAKTQDAYDFLKEEFAQRGIKKTYRAFVYGTLKEDRGIIERPIGSARGGMGPRSATRPHGTMREAVTAYSVRSRYKGEDGATATYVDVFPKTGRTHQLRVHLAAIGHPIVGDALYGRDRTRPAGPLIQRQALHAERLTFRHPHTGLSMSFVAPLAADLVALRRRCSPGARAPAA